MNLVLMKTRKKIPMAVAAEAGISEPILYQNEMLSKKE
jgi:uncharacterized membrane protein (UPF0136 family)